MQATFSLHHNRECEAVAWDWAAVSSDGLGVLIFFFFFSKTVKFVWFSPMHRQLNVFHNRWSQVKGQATVKSRPATRWHVSSGVCHSSISFINKTLLANLTLLNTANVRSSCFFSPFFRSNSCIYLVEIKNCLLVCKLSVTSIHPGPQAQKALSIVNQKSYTHGRSCPSFLPERNEGLPVVEISRVPRCCHHVTADQERAPAHIVKTLAVILTEMKRREYSDLKGRGVYTPGKIDHL